MAAPLAREGAVDAVVRFSNLQATTDRNDEAHVPHGMAIKLVSRAGHAGLDLVTIDITRFTTSTREDFLGLMRRLSRRRWRRWLPVGLFVLGGRSTVPAIACLRVRTLTSYTDRTYHGLNTFYWTLDGPGRPGALPDPATARAGAEAVTIVAHPPGRRAAGSVAATPRHCARRALPRRAGRRVRPAGVPTERRDAALAPFEPGRSSSARWC